MGFDTCKLDDQESMVDVVLLRRTSMVYRMRLMYLEIIKLIQVTWFGDKRANPEGGLFHVKRLKFSSQVSQIPGYFNQDGQLNLVCLAFKCLKQIKWSQFNKLRTLMILLILTRLY